jgi:hypothetical protein
MMCLKFQQDIMNHVILDNMINNEIRGYSNVKLAYINMNIKKQIICVLDPFLYLLWNFDSKKVHNMLTLMLDPWYKNMPLICSFIGHDSNNLVINEYIRSHWSQCLWNVLNFCIKFLKLQIHNLFKWILLQNVICTYFKWEVMIMNLCASVSIESCYFNNLRLMSKK